MKKNLLILSICFVIIMITPASAVHISMSSGSVESNINGKYPNSTFKTVGSKNNCNKKTITYRISTSKNTLNPGKKNEINAKAIDHANNLLPIMEESYKNNSEDISVTKEAIYRLESKKLNTSQELKKIESNLDNFELSSNNTNSYNNLLKEKKEYLSLKESLEITESSIKRMKGILYQKQSHTKNCVDALKQIKKSENIQGAVKTYNKNMESLSFISSNMATEIQQQEDIILYSNKTANNNTNNTNNTVNNSTETESNTVTNILKYAGIGTISATGAVSIASIISIMVYSVTTTNAIAALEAASIAGLAYTTAAATATTSASMWAANSIFLAACTSESLAEAAVGTAATAGLVSTILVVTAAVLVVAALAVMIAYFGFKNHWW
jgi:hypothetical protein